MLNNKIIKIQPDVLEVTAEYDGIRLDRFIKLSINGIQQSHLEKLIGSGGIRVDGKKSKPNYHLRPAPISITKCSIVEDDFHARFSAKERRYVFRLLTRRPPAIVDAGWVWQIQHDLDLELMKESAKYLIGKHDFTTFRSSICQAQSPIKTLDEIIIKQITLKHGNEFEFTIRARSFLHNQVRSFIGTLERVGAGAWEPKRVHDALIAKDRSKCGPVCPPHGLYLDQVSYDTEIFS